MIEVLALDVDGVLVDGSAGGTRHWTDAMHARFGITRGEFREAFFMRVWDDVVNGRRPVEPAVEEALGRLGRDDIEVEEFLACWFDADFVLVDPAIAFAERVRASGRRVVLATNQEHRRAAYLRDHLPLDLDDVLYSADLGVQKHDPRFFELATQRLDVAPQHVLFVDDVEHNVVVARSCGWHAVHAPPGNEWIAEAERLLG